MCLVTLVHFYECCHTEKLNLRKDTSRKSEGVVWRCNSKTWAYKITLRKDSWFKHSHLTIPQIVKLTYYWVHKVQQEVVLRELRIESGHTLVDWYNFAREVCAEILLQDNKVIGGVDHIVEIDESKFGKRKYII